jgi:hypothetical protein
MIFINVVLPQPFGPTSPMRSPGLREKLTPARTLSAPYDLVILVILNIRNLLFLNVTRK